MRAVFFFGKLGNLWKPIENILVSTGLMGDGAVRAIFNAGFRIGKVTAAPIAQRVQRAITE